MMWGYRQIAQASRPGLAIWATLTALAALTVARACPATSDAQSMYVPGDIATVDDIVTVTAPVRGAGFDTFQAGLNAIEAGDPDIVDSKVDVTDILFNQPDPFCSATSIGYKVPVAGHVRIEIFDISGRRIHVLVDGMSNGGKYEIRWDGHDGGGRSMSPGVYLCRITAGRVGQTEKMTLLR
jgi:hypothetical protein